mgnify:CR=1 FL=1
MNRVGVAEIPVESLENIPLSLEDLRLGVRRVCHRKEVADTGGDDFFRLCSDEEASDTNKLELGEGYDARRKEAVDDVDAEEERLGKQPETDMHLDEPVGEDAPHLPGELLLTFHVVGIGHRGDLGKMRWTT